MTLRKSMGFLFLLAFVVTSFYSEANQNQLEQSIQIKQSDIDENGNVNVVLKINVEQVECPVLPIEPDKPEEPNPDFDGQVLFAEDIAQEMPISTVDNPHIPYGLQAQFNIEYQGAFRVVAKTRYGSSNFAAGALSYYAKNHSLFLAGEQNNGVVGEFKIPNRLSMEGDARNILESEVLQWYRPLLKLGSDYRINGLLATDNALIVTSGKWYDANATYRDHIQAFDINQIENELAPPRELQGRDYAAGYMGVVPEDAKIKLGGDYFLGWASNFSITRRYSQGASLYLFNPQDAVTDKLVKTNPLQFYPMEDGKELVAGANKTNNKNISPMWGGMSRARAGFIISNSNIYMVVGRHAGIHGGIFYKQDKTLNTRECSGSCPYDPKDIYNYFWLYNLDDIVNAENPWDAKPFSYGKWILPFKGELIGGAYDPNENRIYLSIYGAGKVGEYDTPPLIISYKITAKG